MKDKVIQFLGLERAERLETQCPGAIDAGIARVNVAELKREEEAVPLAGIRALQIGGSAPTDLDIKVWKACRDGIELPVESAPAAAAPAEAKEEAQAQENPPSTPEEKKAGKGKKAKAE